MSKKVVLLLVLVLAASSLLITVKPASSVSARPAENTWTQKAPIQQARYDLGVAVANGKIYAIGGSVHTYQDYYRVDSELVGTNEEYDPKTDTWSFKASMPTPRSSFATVVYKNKIYCIGGSNGTSDGQPIPTSVNEVYDPATDTWEAKAPMPTARLDAAASVVNGKIYVVGGFHNRTFTRTTNEMYDPATDTWATKAPALYDQAVTSGVSNNKLYFFGCYGTQSSLRMVTQIYDPATDSWSTGAPPPETFQTLAAPAGVTVGFMAPKRFYIFNGEFMPQVYNPEADSWAFGASFPTPRIFFAVAVLDDVIYVIGGMLQVDTLPPPSGGPGIFGLGAVFADYKTVEAYIPLGYGIVPPVIEVDSPQHVNYTTGEVSLNFTVNRNATWTGYSLDGQSNVTVTGNTMLSGLAVGSHNVIVYATDEYGNVGASETVKFTVANPAEPQPKSEPFPTVPVAAVSGASALIVGAGLLVYFRKRRH